MARDPYYLPQPSDLGKPAAADVESLLVTRQDGGIVWTAKIRIVDSDGNPATVHNRTHYQATGAGGIPGVAQILTAAWERLVELGAVEGTP